MTQSDIQTVCSAEKVYLLLCLHRKCWIYSTNVNICAASAGVAVVEGVREREVGGHLLIDSQLDGDPLAQADISDMENTDYFLIQTLLFKRFYLLVDSYKAAKIFYY